MKRIIRTVAIALICGLLAAPQIEAQGRRNNNGGNRPSSSASAPGRGQGNQGNRPSAGNRPAGGQNNGRPTENSRPSGNNRPDCPSSGNHNQGGNHAPGRPSNGGHHNPGGQPAPGGHHAPGRPAPARPNRPPHHEYHRPTPPPTFRPHHGCPVVNGILGITFGTALNISINQLMNSGYIIDSYGNNVVYLRNVREQGYYWNDAALYYGSGGLMGSEFYYTTNYYDIARYNSLYNSFVRQYGSPINYQAVNNGYVATWFGYNNQYISLQFAPIYASNGQLRYVTTLSYGK